MAQFSIAENREVAPVERALLEWLISNGEAEARTFLYQLDTVRVVARCGCGCPTVNLATEGDKTPLMGPSQILADFLGSTKEGVQVGVILHARQGKLSELEVYSLAGTEGPFSLPDVETLKPL